MSHIVKLMNLWELVGSVIINVFDPLDGVEEVFNG
jgi:hypothetical protein